MAPLTVVIPTHNRARLLAEAIESVLGSALALPARNVIVVDDGSTDDTAAVARRFGVRYAQVACGGPSGARNAGLDFVDTEFVTFLDDDDCWLPENMHPQLVALRANPGAAFAFGKMQPTDMNLAPYGGPRPAVPAGVSPLEAALFYNAQVGTMLFRRDAVVDVGGFDPALRYDEDRDLQVRLSLQYPVVAVDCVGLLFRTRPWSLAEVGIQKRAIRDLKVALAKWRSAGVAPSLLLRAEFKTRGFRSYCCARDARHSISVGMSRLAMGQLKDAVFTSPVHAMVHQRILWETVWELCRQAVMGPAPMPSALEDFW
ncbi:MAG: glycosyltransferase family A protein [Chloroflexota bacterium]